MCYIKLLILIFTGLETPKYHSDVNVIWLDAYSVKPQLREYILTLYIELHYIQVYGLLISNAKGKSGQYLQSFEIHIGNSLENEGRANPK